MLGGEGRRDKESQSLQSGCNVNAAGLGLGPVLYVDREYLDACRASFSSYMIIQTTRKEPRMST
jgi:hypothetical protein